MSLATMERYELSRAREILRTCHLFSVLDDSQFDAVLSAVRRRELSSGQRLFDQGQPCHEFFLIEAGQIKLMRHSVEGEEKVIELISAGNTFAEALMFGHRDCYPVSAEAVGSTRLWCIDARRYAATLQASSSACFAMLGQLSQRLHWCMAEIEHLTLHSALQRLVFYLLDTAVYDERGGARVTLAAPKRVLASRLSMTPETLSRLLGTLEKAGLVLAHGSKLTLPDVEHLESLARVDHSRANAW